MTAVTIQSNRMASNIIKGQLCATRAIVQKKSHTDFLANPIEIHLLNRDCDLRVTKPIALSNLLSPRVCPLLLCPALCVPF